MCVTRDEKASSKINSYLKKSFTSVSQSTLAVSVYFKTLCNTHILTFHYFVICPLSVNTQANSDSSRVSSVTSAKMCLQTKCITSILDKLPNLKGAEPFSVVLYKLYSTASIYGVATRVQHHTTRWTDVANRWTKTWGRQGLISTTGTLTVHKSRKILLICVSVRMFVPVPRLDWLGKWFVFRESEEYLTDRKVTVPTVWLGVTVFWGL